MREAALGLAAVLALSGCQALGMKDDSSVELERHFQDSDLKVRENRTLSALAEMETALAMDGLHLLPNDPDAVERALMEGCPVSAGSQFGRSLATLARRLNNQESASAKQSPGNRLRSLFSR